MRSLAREDKMRRQVRRVHGISLLYVGNKTLLHSLRRLVQTKVSFKRIRADGMNTRPARKEKRKTCADYSLCAVGKARFSCNM